MCVPQFVGSLDRFFFINKKNLLCMSVFGKGTPTHFPNSHFGIKVDDRIVAVRRSEGTVRCSLTRVQTAQIMLLSRPRRQHPMCSPFLSPCYVLRERGKKIYMLTDRLGRVDGLAPAPWVSSRLRITRHQWFLANNRARTLKRGFH